MGCGSSKDAAVSSDPWELASRGQARQLERWLEMGGNPSALDRQGGRGTLLHAAAQHDQVECIRVLLRNGADVNAVTKLRGSPLHAAAMHSTGVSVRVLLDSGADPLLKNAEGKSAVDVAIANGFANLAQLMRDVANRQAVKRREASGAHYSDGSAASLPRMSAPGTPAADGYARGAGQQAQQFRGPSHMQPRVSGAFGYPEWNATVSTNPQPQAGQARFRGLPSEMMTLATQPGAQQAQQAQAPQQARVSPQAPLQARVSPQPAAAAAAVECAPAADAAQHPSPFDQAAGQRSTPPATPPRGSPGGVTPSSSSNNLAKQPTTAEAYLAQFKEAASQGQAGSGEQRQLSAGSSGLSSTRQGSGAPPSGSGEASAVPPHLMRNAGGVPAWWLGPQPSVGQSPRHVRNVSPPTIQEGIPLAAAAAAPVNGGAVGHASQAGDQQHDVNTGSSTTSGGSSSLLLTDPLLNWVNTHMKAAGGAAASPPPPPAPAPERSTSVASGSSNILSGGSNMSSGLLSHRSTMVDIKPWEIDYDDLVIQRPIGEGSFGKVYLAKWNETLVAVKLLLSLQDIQKVTGPEAALTLSSPVLFNLQKECQLMAGMRHPNIVQFMGVSAMPPAMVTEYCGKGSLTDVLRGAVANPKQAQMLTWARRLNLALDAAKGMLYLHRRGIIHRDLKSPNLLVDSTWRVKIADFNLSKIIDVDGQNAKTGTMAGANPKWLAPEVIAGQPATVAGDVFSFGVVLWELLTWAIPWQRQSPWTVVAQVLGGKRLTIPPTEQLPGSPADNAAFAQQLPAYVELVKRCWSQDPTDRPEFDEIIKELRKFCEACVPQRAPQSA